MYLIVRQKNRVLQHLDLDAYDALLIGRDPSCQLVLQDSMVSRLQDRKSVV